MYLQLYPRSDFMHWVTAAPLSLAVLAGLIAAWTRRLEQPLSHARRVLLRVAVLVPLVATVVLRAAPALDAVSDWHGLVPGWARSVRLQSERAPVWMNAGRAARYRNLSTLLEFLQRATAPTDAVFTFPSLDVVSFLSDRNNPTRHGYFYPRWPGHDVEAEVLAALEQNPPEYAVILDDDSLFFFYAPVYYYGLRDFIETNYRPYLRCGRYLVVRRRDAPAPDSPPRLSAVATPAGIRSELDAAGLDAIVAGLASNDPARELNALDSARQLRLASYVPEIAQALRNSDSGVRDRAVWALFECDDPRCAAALARAVRYRRLSVRESVLALRAISRSGGASAVEDLLVTALRRQGRLADGAATTLFHVVSRQVLQPFRFARLPKVQADDDAPGGRLPKSRRLRRIVRGAIDDESADPRLRSYAIWASADFDEAEVLDRLVVAAASPDPEIAKLALLALVERGHAGEHVRNALELLALDPYFSPTILLTALPESHDGDRRLARLVTAAAPEARIEAIWLAAMIGGRRTDRAVVGALQDPDPNVRCASIWALQRRGDRAYARVIEPLLTDSDYRVRAFAERALRDLRGEDP